MPIFVPQVQDPGSTVTLSAIFLNLAADPSDFVSFSVETSQLSPTTDQAGEVRAMANGGLRLVLQATKARTYALSLTLLTRAQVSWLQDHIGELVCIRDDRGRKFFGVWLSVPVDESVWTNQRADSLSLTINEVTYSEAV